MMVLSIFSIVLAVAALVYTGHCAIVFQRFNDGIKQWAESLDDSTRDAIERSARNILRELDEKISSMNEENDNLKDSESMNE